MYQEHLVASERLLLVRLLLLLLQVCLGLGPLDPVEGALLALLVVLLNITKLVMLVLLSRLYDLAGKFRLLFVQEGLVDGLGLAYDGEELVVTESGAVLALLLHDHFTLSVGQRLPHFAVCVRRWHTAHVNLLLRDLALRRIHHKEVVFVVLSRLRKEVVLDLMVLDNLSQERHLANDLFKGLALHD